VVNGYASRLLSTINKLVRFMSLYNLEFDTNTNYKCQEFWAPIQAVLCNQLYVPHMESDNTFASCQRASAAPRCFTRLAPGSTATLSHSFTTSPGLTPPSQATQSDFQNGISPSVPFAYWWCSIPIRFRAIDHLYHIVWAAGAAFGVSDI
jgi:hypothetical protein